MSSCPFGGVPPTLGSRDGEGRPGRDADDVRADIIVVGSGGAGLAAALAAANCGAEVVVVEKTMQLGGTTAISGGTMWLPANHLAAAAGYADSREEALRYLVAGGGETANTALLEAFVDTAPRMLRFLEDSTPTGFYLARDTDYHAELAGGKEIGRSILPMAFDPASLGVWAGLIREQEAPLDIAEAYGSLNRAEDAPGGPPYDAKKWTRGRALVGALVAGCLDRGVVFATGHRARRLLREHERVTGLDVEKADGSLRLIGSKGVILASGGFEWDAALVSQFLPAPLEAPGSPPSIEGDGLRMAMAAGAGLGSMAEAWWSPMIRIPGEIYDGCALSRMAVSQRLYPRSIMVNQAGERFTNEAQSYHDVGGVLMSIDRGLGRCPHRPAWLIFDARYRRHYGVACVAPAAPDPPWLVPFATLETLALHYGIDDAVLVRTVAAFNRHAVAGHDPVFRRGETLYSWSKGDRSQEGVFRTLGPIDTPPYYAVRLHAGTIGTRGGPLVDVDARVLDAWGEAIPGLFAAGNVAASPTGLLYPGAGGTLGLALTFGYRAGLAAAGRDLSVQDSPAKTDRDG